MKAAALRIIDENLDLEKWDGSPLRRKRAAALVQARKKLESPPPRAMLLPKPLPVQLQTGGIQCGNHLYNLASPKHSPLPPERFMHLGLANPVARGEAIPAYCGIGGGETLDDLLDDVLEPYWENLSLPPHHPGFDKPEARLFKRQT